MKNKEIQPEDIWNNKKRDEVKKVINKHLELERELKAMLLEYQWNFNTPDVRAEIKLRADVICETYANKNLKMNIDIDYKKNYNESENISTDILDEILKNDEYFDITEKMVLKEVESPFIIPDNEYDHNEMNNYILKINAKEIRSVFFKGGSYYTIYERDNHSLESYIVHGNGEEGFNIFKLI